MAPCPDRPRSRLGTTARGGASSWLARGSCGRGAARVVHVDAPRPRGRARLISTVPRPSVTQLAELPEAECLQLLERRNLGRIALVVDGQPRIFPVNYSMNGRIIAFRTGAGDILAHAPDSKAASEMKKQIANMLA